MILTESDGKTVTVCIRLTKADVAHLDERARIEKRTRGNLAAKIITDYLENYLETTP